MNTHHVGITASRTTPTYAQLLTLTTLLANEKRLAECFGPEVVTWLHHGDCVGGDELAHDIAKMLGYKNHIHPPTDNKLRAHKRGDKIEPAKPYIERNHDIVHEVSSMYVMPDSFEEKLRSGTWATWRYTKTRGIHWVIIYPDSTFKRGKGRWRNPNPLT